MRLEAQKTSKACDNWAEVLCSKKDKNTNIRDFYKLLEDLSRKRDP